VKAKILMLLLVLMLFVGTGCVRMLHKEFEIVDGKSLIRSETEYDRIGDQELSGVEVAKDTPDGTQVKVKVDTQKSEGNAPGLISAIGEAIKPFLAGGALTPEIETAIAEAVANSSQ
jgi:hypothetical protein